MKWTQRELSQETMSLLSSLNLTEIGVHMLERLGFTTQQEVDEFLGPGTIHDPEDIPNLSEAVDRIQDYILSQRAAKNKIPIGIFGDYDADGVTASAIMKLAIEHVGGTAKVRLPDRQEGYGVSKKAIDELNDAGVKLLITVDNGIRAWNELDYAKNNCGMNVIVLDHHVPGEDVPKAYATIVDLHWNNGKYPFVHLTGSGLAWKAASLLLSRFDKEKYAESLVDLAAIGTIADVEVLLGENRSIVKRAIKRMQYPQYDRFGIRWLMGNNLQHITAEDVAFRIGPCINACGRIMEKGAEIPLDLILEKNQIFGAQKAQRVIGINQKRKDMQAACYAKIKAEAEQMVKNGDKVLVLWSNDAVPGIVGLLAGNLKEEFHRPAIVFCNQIDDQRFFVGSARSIEGFNIVKALDYAAAKQKNPCPLVKYGGHAMAAGMTIEGYLLDDLRRLLNEKAQQDLPDEALVPTATYDMVLPDRNIDIVTARQIAAFEPFGVGFTRPIFKVEHFVPKSKGGKLFDELGQGAKHLKLAGDGFNVIGFNMLDRYIKDGTPRKLTLYGNINVNYFQGREYVQFSLLDYEAEEVKTTPLAAALSAALQNI